MAIEDELFESLPWLKAPPPFFRRPPPKGGPSRQGPEYREHRKKETWAYVVRLELLKGAKSGGRVEIRKYTGALIGRASFSDMNEGTRLFDELWEEAQDLTKEQENALSK